MEFVYKQSPAYLINILARLFNQSLSTRLAPHNTSPAQLPVLLSLWQKDGQTQSELCRRMRIEQPTLANTLKRMVRDRLVRKVPDTNDRRQTIIKLTQRGRDLKPILTQSALEVHTTAMQGLTEAGLETMLMMVNKIISNLDNDLNDDPLVLGDALLEPVEAVQPTQPTENEAVEQDELQQDADQQAAASPHQETASAPDSDETGGNGDGNRDGNDKGDNDGDNDGDDIGEDADDDDDGLLVLRDIDIVRD